MSKALSAAILLALAGSASAIPPEKLEQLADQVDPQVIAWRRDFHQHPELGNREVRTSKIVAEELKKLGLEPVTGIAKTGVVALLEGGKPGPRLLLRADMDALPVTERTNLPFKSVAKGEYRGEEVGVMHACGHDAHTAILLGVAKALVSVKAELPGSVLFVFQPAEEGPPPGEEGGAALMVKEGVLDRWKPDAALGLHVFSTLNVGDVGLRSGPLMAESDSFEIVVKGRQTHGARPWGGVDPITASAQIVNAVNTIVSRQTDITKNPAVVSFGIVEGGVRYNIIPDEVKLAGTIRTFDEAQRDEIYADLRRTVEKTAEAAGATATVDIKQHTPVTKNDPALTASVTKSLEAVVGADHVIEVPLTTGAEDYAEFSNRIPGVYYFVGVTPRGVDAASAPSNHSPEFQIDEAGIAVGIRTMLRAAVDYLGSKPAG